MEETSMSDWESEFGGDVAIAEQFMEEAMERRHWKQNFRRETWCTKDGREIEIKDMDDRHLFNAYRCSGNSLLFREMVLRLFEERMKR
jgi:hypothetical protein